MKFHKRSFLVIKVFLLCLLSKGYGVVHLAPDTTSRLARIQKRGILRIGVPGDYAPFAIARGESLYGADIRLGRALAAAIGVTPVFVKTSWPNLTSDMRNDMFDLALGGISITPERAALASFSALYHAGGKTFLCRRMDSARFADSAVVNNPVTRLIVNRGGTNESVARALFAKATLMVFPNNTGVFDELIAGRADVMVTDDTEADLKAKQYPQLCRSFPGTFTKSNKALWIHTDKALVDFVNNWLQQALTAGTPQQWLKEAMSQKN
jgi:cyclohexadienyl dehydratase